MLTRRAAALLLVLAAGVAGCGDAPERPAAGPLPYAAKDPVPGTTDLPTAAILRGPIAGYRRHVRSELAGMSRDVDALHAAAAAGRLAAARAAWLRADARYERIGAAYGAFGALDERINGSAEGLAGGTGSPSFRGLHRVELALWGRRSASDAARPADGLRADVRRLRRRLGSGVIDPLDFGLRAHEILEDTLHGPLAGHGPAWSGNTLDVVAANVAGTRVVLGNLAPLIAHRDPLVLRQSRRALARLDAAVRTLRRAAPGRRWDALGLRDRERIAGLTAAAAEQLAFVPALVDPRPPRPLQRAAEPPA